MPEELKPEPCPWCLSEHIEVTNLYSNDLLPAFQIRCEQCGAKRSDRGSWPSRENAIRAWNDRRAPERSALPSFGKWTRAGVEQIIRMHMAPNLTGVTVDFLAPILAAALCEGMPPERSAEPEARDAYVVMSVDAANPRLVTAHRTVEGYVVGQRPALGDFIAEREDGAWQCVTVNPKTGAPRPAAPPAEPAPLTESVTICGATEQAATTFYCTKPPGHDGHHSGGGMSWGTLAPPAEPDCPRCAGNLSTYHALGCRAGWKERIDEIHARAQRTYAEFAKRDRDAVEAALWEPPAEPKPPPSTWGKFIRTWADDTLDLSAPPAEEPEYPTPEEDEWMNAPMGSGSITNPAPAPPEGEEPGPFDGISETSRPDGPLDTPERVAEYLAGWMDRLDTDSARRMTLAVLRAMLEYPAPAAPGEGEGDALATLFKDIEPTLGMRLRGINTLQADLAARLRDLEERVERQTFDSSNPPDALRAVADRVRALEQTCDRRQTVSDRFASRVEALEGQMLRDGEGLLIEAAFERIGRRISALEKRNAAVADQLQRLFAYDLERRRQFAESQRRLDALERRQSGCEE